MGVPYALGALYVRAVSAVLDAALAPAEPASDSVARRSEAVSLWAELSLPSCQERVAPLAERVVSSCQAPGAPALLILRERLARGAVPAPKLPLVRESFEVVASSPSVVAQRWSAEGSSPGADGRGAALAAMVSGVLPRDDWRPAHAAPCAREPCHRPRSIALASEKQW